ncbi:MAG TPA: hypothetical protein VFV38_37185 [Ktedonobacteraceae bacterium]|nr:hypothetical protein [Ktedonobacteraceae bacterium]
MQTDTWLTGIPYPDSCPLCSQPLASNSNICSACGFTAHELVRTSTPIPRQAVPGSLPGRSNPITPIPPRASARLARSSPDGQFRRAPAPKLDRPSRGPKAQARSASWHHNSSRYEAASSLSSLSLIIAETPTAPPRAARRPSHETGELQHIDEIDTLPPAPGNHSATLIPGNQVAATSGSLALGRDKSVLPDPALLVTGNAHPDSLQHIDEIDTQPERSEALSRATVPSHKEHRKASVSAASWTARLASDSQPGKNYYAQNFHLLDRLRWWFLRPGHIEFLLWLAGLILLFSITFLLLLATVFSATLPGRQSSGNLPSSATSNASVTATTPPVSSSPHLTLPGKTLLAPGAQLQLQGQGFWPGGKVTFLLDSRWPLLDQSQQAAWIRADASGRFNVTLWLGQGPDWSPGPHQIFAHDMHSDHQAAVSLTILQPTPTPVASNPGVYPTPPTRPTAPPIQATPTQVITPTPAPSPTPTASPATPAATATATQGQGASPSNLGNEVNSNEGNTPLVHLAHLNPLIWLIATCYLLSMLLLGIAVILHRRRPKRG